MRSRPMRHQLLILYRHNAAKLDELRWLLRSLRNVRGCYSVPLVVGDPPQWYTGPRLTFPATRARDVDAKLRAIAGSDRVADDFVLFADDTIVASEIQFDDLQVMRHGPSHFDRPGQDRWSRALVGTLQFCQSQGWPAINVSTPHWPYSWNRRRLAQTLSLIGDRRLLVESVYVAQHGVATLPAGEDCQYRKFAGLPEAGAKIVNYGDQAFVRGIRQWAMEHFPVPSPWETGEVPATEVITGVMPGTFQVCAHLGEVERLQGRRPVFGCAMFGETMLAAATSQDRSCDRCRSFRPSDPPRVVTIGSGASGAKREAMDTPPVGPAFFRANPCPHRGEIVDQRMGRACITGNQPVEIRACDRHGKCSSVTFNRPQPDDVRACGGCELLPRC